MEYLGRIDDQVKLRGFRVELGEIEAVLREHAVVRECSVIVREDRPGDKRLVAYIVAEPDVPVEARTLREFLEQHLPPYMIPNFFVTLNELPLTINGKVNRRALPAPDGVRPSVRSAYAAPRTSVEKDLASIWIDTLGIDRVGLHDNFFELGGHSLLAAQVMARIPERFGVTLPLSRIFETPSLEALAELIETVRWAVEERESGASGEEIAREEGEI